MPIISSIWPNRFQSVDLLTEGLISPSQTGITDITSFEIMNVNDVSHHVIMGMKSLNYNGRIFMADIYTRFYDGFDIANIIQSAGSSATPFTIYMEIDLLTEYGVKTVRQSMAWAYDSIKIPYLLCYPDMRASEIRIIHNSVGPTTYKKITFALESHLSLNLSYATEKDGVDVTIACKDTDGFQTILISAISTTATLATLDGEIRDKNRIQLTEQANPYTLPVSNSYQVGEGTVLAMAINMMPLEDKFGTFPVFVFSSRGIWALNLDDSGDVFISNIVPVSNAVCINADSVIAIDNLLVFLASDGIKLLTGQTPAEISDIAEGSITSALSGNSTYAEIIAQSSLAVMTGLVSAVDILTYAATAKFGFDKNHRELIISNSTYSYSYIYSLDEQIWYKCSQKFKSFVNNYPNIYAFNTDNDLVDVSLEDSTGDTGVFFESRPIQLTEDRPMKIQRIILGGHFDISVAKYGAMYVFGSNDGQQWSIITGKEINGLSIYSIIIPRLALSLRYIIIVFSGTLKEESAITEIRMLT